MDVIIHAGIEGNLCLQKIKTMINLITYYFI